jgi:PAS domain S-box-containing protein
MKGRSPGTASGRVAVVRWIGVYLGVVITLGLLFTIFQDLTARTEAARRQSMAVTVGVDRLLYFEVRNLERAMRGMAVVADGYALEQEDRSRWDLPGEIRGVVSRHAELQDIDLYGTQGHAIYRGVSAYGQDALEIEAAMAQARTLGVGRLVMEGRAEPIVPLVLRTPEGNWLVARLRTTELQKMLEGLDVGRQGSVGILSHDGVVLARLGASGAHVGRQVPLPDELRPGTTVQHDVVSQLDGVERFASFSLTSGYPFVVAAGVSKREALAPWRNYAVTALVLLALYWLGTFYLMRRTSRSEAARDQAHEELLRHADWLSKAQEASQAGVWAMEQGSGAVRASAHAARLFGFPPVPGMLPLDGFFQRMHPEDRDRVEQAFAEAWESGRAFHSEYRILLPDGRQRWIDAKGALVHDGDQVPRMTGTIVDVSERRHQQAHIERAETQFRELFELNPLPFWVFDVASLRFLAVNEAAIRRYGYSREEFLGMTILQIRPPEQSADVQDSVVATAEPRDASRVWIHAARDGRRFHVRIHSSSIRFDGHDARLVLAEDVSERVAYEQALAWRAQHDEATGLLNLRTFLERVEQLPAGTAETGYAVVYVQLRDLELVSPMFGRRTRDEIVAAIAARLAAIGGGFGPVAYVPADAFVIAAPQAERWEVLVDQMQALFEASVVSDTGSHRVEAWMGVAFRQRSGESGEDVVGHAALAAVQARAENVPTMHYADLLGEKASARVAIVGRMRNALSNGEFELFFQPIQRVRDGRVVAAEALLRWRTPEGYVPPSSFIPLSEESGLIVPIGEWVIEQAAQAQAALVSAGFAQVAVAVNVSAVQFMAGSVPRLIREAGRRHGLARGALHVELTESAMLRRPDAAKFAMEELQQDGVCVSIDDFGTGFSSMAYLRDLSLDHLKIDRSFVDHVDQDPRNASICRALIALGKGLELSIVAEGVERAEELAWLSTHAVDHVQGYYIARPAPLGAFIAWLAGRVAPANT